MLIRTFEVLLVKEYLKLLPSVSPNDIYFCNLSIAKTYCICLKFCISKIILVGI